MLDLFNFKGKDIRFINGKPVAKDVAEVLGYADPTSTVSKRIKPKYKGVDKLATAGGIQSVTVLEEGGIYQLVIGSKLDTAEEFQDWLFEEVLPSIRKTGSYSITKPSELSRKDILLMALEAEEEKLKFQAEVERQKLIISLKDETIEAQQEQLTEWHPLVENYKQFLDADGLISFGEAGKMLQTGRNRLITVLRLYGFLLLEKNEPLQKWMKYFELKVKVRKHPSTDGSYKSDVVTLFTPEGFNRVIKIMVGKAGSQEKLVEYLQKPAKLHALLTEKVEEKKDEATHALEAVYDDILNFA